MGKINLNSKDYTYANLNILTIKRLLEQSEYNTRDFAANEIINIALDILRIMCEIPFAVYDNKQYDEYEWELFFNAEKTGDGVIRLMTYLFRNAEGKNLILNEVFNSLTVEDMEKYIRIINDESGDD